MLKVERKTVKLVPLSSVAPGMVVEVGGTTLYLVYLRGDGTKSVVNLRDFCEVFIDSDVFVQVMTVAQQPRVEG